MKRIAAMILAAALLTVCAVSAGEGEIRKPAADEIHAGVSIILGRYADEAIEWTVLEVQGGKALVISRYGLNTMSYGESRKDTMWESSKLRTWLNDGFLRWGFSKEERDAILVTAVENGPDQGYSGWDTDGGNDTEDQVFLLSYAEANRYFGVTPEDRENIRARVRPTGMAVRSAKTGDSPAGDGMPAAAWWLRSPGHSASYAAAVGMDGALEDVGVGSMITCVRPAMWLNINAEAVRAGIWNPEEAETGGDPDAGSDEIKMLYRGYPTALTVRECAFSKENHTAYSVTLEGIDVLEAARKGSLSELIPFKAAIAWEDGSVMESTSYGISYTGEPITILRFESGDGTSVREPDYFLITEKGKDFSQGWRYEISEKVFRRAEQ